MTRASAREDPCADMQPLSTKGHRTCTLEQPNSLAVDELSMPTDSPPVARTSTERLRRSSVAQSTRGVEHAPEQVVPGLSIGRRDLNGAEFSANEGKR